MAQSFRGAMLAFGLLICMNLAHADCWRLPDHRLMRTNAGVKPNVAGAKREACPAERTPAQQRDIDLLRIQQEVAQRQRAFEVQRELAEKTRSKGGAGRQLELPK